MNTAAVLNQIPAVKAETVAKIRAEIANGSDPVELAMSLIAQGDAEGWSTEAKLLVLKAVSQAIA